MSSQSAPSMEAASPLHRAPSTSTVAIYSSNGKRLHLYCLDLSSLAVACMQLGSTCSWSRIVDTDGNYSSGHRLV